MIFNWINHPQMKKHEKFMAVLYDLGMVTKEQLSIITGWSIVDITNSVKLSRNLAKTKEERTLIIQSVYLPNKNRSVPCAYKLGKYGLKYVDGLLHNEKKSKEIPASQLHHYMNRTDKLIRFLVDLNAMNLDQSLIKDLSSTTVYHLMQEYYSEDRKEKPIPHLALSERVKVQEIRDKFKTLPLKKGEFTDDLYESSGV